MIFFPYRADHEIRYIPLLTILISIVCIVVYIQQEKNAKELDLAIDGFCGVQQPQIYRLALNALYGSSTTGECVDFILGMHTAERQDDYLSDAIKESDPLAGFNRTDSNQYLDKVLRENYELFARAAPEYLTYELSYHPQSWNPLTMLTAAFAHASWDHVLFNLIFFFAFAATVEAILGYLFFPVAITTIAVLSHVFYSVVMLGVVDPPPTVGLSGVVSGVMAMFVYFLPHTKIRCFFWFIIFIKRFNVSAWLFVAFFIGWDIFYLFNDEDSSNINFAAHVGGAMVGYLLGLILFRRQKREVNQIDY
ncbi:MAG: rhomboid family intramembrane serine protease [Candidatus Thiodiazotropha lotti]|nr:rhomboid family intramembrane serine protease [Candidatus Thiodiazotropha lotti]